MSELIFTPVIAFSGGRTSAYMLRMLLSKYPGLPGWRILFCNTGKEFDATLDFVHECETRWGVPVTWLEYCRVPATEEIAAYYPHKKSQKTVREQVEAGENTHWFRVVDYKTAHRNGTPDSPFDQMLAWSGTLPNVQGRGCSGQLKVRTMMRYLFSEGVAEWDDHIGIRADEAHRALDIQAASPAYRRAHFPLINDGVSVGDVDAFWRGNDFDLRLRSHEGNCDLCFLKAWWKRVAITKANPALAQWWIGWEREFQRRLALKGDGATFRKGQSYEGLLSDAMHPEFAFTDAETTFGAPQPCGCTEGAYRFEKAENAAA